MSKRPPKLNDRQRLFAENVVAGMSQAAAYKLAFGKSDRRAASKLATKHDVSALIESLRADAAKASSLSKADLVAKLVEIIESPPSAASMSNPLCELRMSKLGPFAVFPDKSGAIERLSKLLGYYTPEKPGIHTNLTVVIGGNAEQ